MEVCPLPDGEIVEFWDARTKYVPTSMITEGEALTPTFPNGCSSNHSNLWLRQSQCLQPQLFNSDLSDQKPRQYEIKRIVYLAILDQKDHRTNFWILYLHWALKHSPSDKIFPLTAPRAWKIGFFTSPNSFYEQATFFLHIVSKDICHTKGSERSLCRKAHRR